MGEVIAFHTRARPAPRSSGPATGGAQILFFLGVRYMRFEEPAEALTTLSPDHGHGPRGGKKRRTRARA